MTTAAAIIIGDAILSAKIRDANTPLLIDLLAELGVELERIVFIGDDSEVIANEVAACSKKILAIGARRWSGDPERDGREWAR